MRKSKIFVSFLLAGLLSFASLAGASDVIRSVTLWSGVTVNGTGNVETDPVNTNRWSSIDGILFKATSAAGTAAVKLEVAVSPDGTNWQSYDYEADIISDTSSLTDPEGWHQVAPPLVIPPYVKFKVTGLGTNPADTVVSGYLYYHR